MSRPRPPERPSAPLPFSRPLAVDSIPEGGIDEAIEADHAERTAVAGELGLVGIGALSATFHVEKRSGKRVHLGGSVKATITQMCVVSLEPFSSEVEQPIDIDFSTPLKTPEHENGRGRHIPSVSRRRNAEARTAPPVATSPSTVDLEEADPPDPIIDGRIDLGGVAVEFLTLGLEFFPRKPGVAFTDTAVGDTDDPEPSAFAVLERLKDRS